MFKYNYEKRFSVEEALNHPFFDDILEEYDSLLRFGK